MNPHRFDEQLYTRQDGPGAALDEAEGPEQRYIIGIDLGTTNSAVAYIDLHAEQAGAGSGARRTIHLFEIPQLVAPGEVANRPLLPSFLYLPGEHELPPGSTALPWAEERSQIVGEFAREQGARARPPGLLGQVVVEPQPGGSYRADSTLGRTRRCRQNLAGGGRTALFGTHGRGVECNDGAGRRRLRRSQAL